MISKEPSACVTLPLEGRRAVAPQFRSQPGAARGFRLSQSLRSERGGPAPYRASTSKSPPQKGEKTQEGRGKGLLPAVEPTKDPSRRSRGKGRDEKKSHPLGPSLSLPI